MKKCIDAYMQLCSYAFMYVCSRVCLRLDMCMCYCVYVLYVRVHVFM